MRAPVTFVEADHLYSLETWPLTIAGIGVGVSAAVVVVRALLRAKDRNTSWAAPLALVLGLVALLGGLACSGIVWINVALQQSFWPPARTTWQLFTGTMVVGSALGVTAAVLAMVYAVLAQRRCAPVPGAGRWLAPVLSGTLAIAFLASQVGPGFCMWLQRRGGLPRIEHEHVPWIHVGERATLRLELKRGKAEGWDAPKPIRLVGRRTGRLSLYASAVNGPLRVERRWTIRARSATSHPSLPLRVGHRWRYRWRQTTSGAFLWGIIQSDGRAAEGTVELAVTETRAVRGARQFKLSRFDQRGTTKHWWVYPLDGRTFVARGEHPAITDEELIMPPPGSSAAFSIPMLPGHCRGVSTGPIRGACTCDRTSGPDVPSVVAAVLTAGLVIPRSGARTALVLESSEEGTGLAAMPGPAPPGASVAAPTPPACDLPDDRRAWFCVALRTDAPATRTELVRRLARLGLGAAEISDGRVVMRARRDQISRLLGARLRGRAVATSPCPGFRCRPEIIRERAVGALADVTSMALDLDACASLP